MFHAKSSQVSLVLCSVLQGLVFRLTEQNVKLVEILKGYEESVIENQVLHLELQNAREEIIKKGNESRQLHQKCSDAKVLCHLLRPSILYIA
jgi:hypothetical protein